MSDKLKDDNMDFLFKSVIRLETEEECYKFFADLCTVQELKAMAQRLCVAKMLKEHKVYNDIAKATGASTATISRVNRSLSYGSDGYLMILDRMSNISEDE